MVIIRNHCSSIKEKRACVRFFERMRSVRLYINLRWKHLRSTSIIQSSRLFKENAGKKHNVSNYKNDKYKYKYMINDNYMQQYVHMYINVYIK